MKIKKEEIIKYINEVIKQKEKKKLKPNNNNWKFMARMNDTPENRKGMEDLLDLGPNQDRTYSKYKLPWK
jgi:hypothetical protein